MSILYSDFSKAGHLEGKAKCVHGIVCSANERVMGKTGLALPRDEQALACLGHPEVAHNQCSVAFETSGLCKVQGQQ